MTPVALFDRLLDEAIDPRESVRRELARLFDTRAPADAEALPDLLAWGVPEWRGISAGDEPALRRFCRRLRDAILRFEPRLRTLTVSIVGGDALSLHLRLEATLRDEAQTPLTLRLSWSAGGWRGPSSGDDHG